MASLYLTSLTLSHFRSHQKSTLTCDTRPVAIYGANGAGKTNILEAISLFSPGRGLRRASAQDMTRRPEASGWKVSGVLHTPAGVHEVDIRSKQGAARQTRINDKPTPQTRLGELCRVLWLIPSMDRLWIEGAEGRRRFLDRMTLSFYPDHAEATLTYEKFMRERNRLLKDQVRDPAWYNALERQMGESGALIHANRLAALDHLQTAQNDAQTTFPAAILSLVQIDGGEHPQGPQDLMQALSDSRSRDLAAGRTFIGPHRSDLTAIYLAKDVPASDCSTGEQKALLISLILTNARALSYDFGAAPILLLDEVAAHLDPDRRAAFYDEICALGAQAWMTATEASLFDDLGSRAQYLGVADDGISRILHATS